MLAPEPAHSAARSAPDRLASAKFNATVQRIAQEKAERTYPSQANASVTRVAEEVLPNALQIGYKSAKTGLKNNPYNFYESVLTKMSHKRALNEVFDRHIKLWILSSTFMGAFAKRVLTFFRFVRPVLNLIAKT